MYVHTESEYYTKLTVCVNMTCFAYHKFNIYNEITAARSHAQVYEQAKITGRM